MHLQDDGFPRHGDWATTGAAGLSVPYQAPAPATSRAAREILHPCIEELRGLIEGDAEIFTLLNKALDQIPSGDEYARDPLGRPQARTYEGLLSKLNEATTQAPEYGGPGLILMGLPFGSVVNWIMGTEAGAAFFLNDKVTAQFDRILSVWAQFLSTEASLYVINDSPKGWLCPTAMKVMMAGSKSGSKPRFEDEYLCDPSKPYYGFRSWDEFFTRKLQPGARPITSADDDTTITNACESAPFRVARNVSELDHFWLKSQRYSLRHMLANDPWTMQFVGGTVYQAFLSSESYHRWHAPVDGRVVKTVRVPGTCFSKVVKSGTFDANDPMHSQAYITQVSSRALIFIEARNPEIGLMCVMPVGMGECSSCEVVVEQGQTVRKGDLLGMFHFGGSTHCLFFRPGVQVAFDLGEQEPGPHAQVIPVNRNIATIKPAS